MEVEVLEIGSQKQLLIDNWIVEDVWQIRRRIHPGRKHPQNPLLVPDKPWEVNTVGLYG